MSEGTKRRIRRFFIYAAVVVLTGLINGNLMCALSCLTRITGFPGFTFSCLFMVVFSSAEYYFVLFKKKDISNLYKLAVLAVSYLACGTSVTVFWRLWGMLLKANAAEKAGREAYIMFVTYLPIDITFLLVCYIVYMTVRVVKLMKEGEKNGSDTVRESTSGNESVPDGENEYFGDTLDGEECKRTAGRKK